jgi:hypothetical protein
LPSTDDAAPKGGPAALNESFDGVGVFGCVDLVGVLIFFAGVVFAVVVFGAASSGAVAAGSLCAGDVSGVGFWM